MTQITDALENAKIHPDLRPLVKDFLLKCHYPFEIKGWGAYKYIDAHREYYHVGVAFIDPEAPHSMNRHAGGLKLIFPNEGSKAKTKYRIMGRKLLHDKFYDNERRNSVETVAAPKVVKLMLEHIIPITIPEIASATLSLGTQAETHWRNEQYQQGFNSFEDIKRTTWVVELRNLVSQGVTFKTPEVQQLAAEGIAAYDETLRRQSVPIRKCFVFFKRDGCIYVSYEGGTSIDRFNSIEELPEFIQQGIGILKLVPVKEVINGLGVRVDENSYWVIDKDETV